MKKTICIIMACFFLVMVPVRSYASALPFFGIGEEIILPFLLSLLGVQAAESVDTYQDLVDYNTKIKGSLLENVSGLAGMEQVQEWIFNAVNGLIKTDSVIWQKLYEIAISNYTVSSAEIGNVTNNNIFEIPAFQFYNQGNITIKDYWNGRVYVSMSGYQASTILYTDITNSSQKRSYCICASSVDVNNSLSYTHDNKTVYYKVNSFTADLTNYIYDPTPIDYTSSFQYAIDDYEQISWLMIYGAESSSENIAGYSDAFDNVLSSSDKEDIIDGSNVIQLYNPAELQNGLEIIPGGDPEDDPNLKRIPFAVTADWWNFLQQFGSGTSSNQYVNAYNALNGLDNTSVGRISDAYDSLGIASIAGAAANAAQGIISLTDQNIYPNAQTAADAITNTIPGSLTPVSPDSGITNESDQGLYKLPDLRDYFPFCIPFDLVNLLSCFVAEPETPEFVIRVSTGFSSADQSVSLEVWDNIAGMVRTFELAAFVLALILVTRNLIRG